MFRLLLLLFPLAAVFAARPTGYTTDMVLLQGSQAMQTTKLCASGQKSRVEGFTAGPLGKIVTNSRRDRGVTWTLYLDKKQYTEEPLAAGRQPGQPDLANFDPANLKKENSGRETVLGYPCTKMRVTMGNLPNGQALVATAWVADSLELPLRLETMGIIQENRNLKLGPQPAGMTPPSGAGAGRSASTVASSGTVSAAGRAAGNAAAAQVPPRRDDRQTFAARTAPSPAAAAWKVNTNYPGGDYRSIDMATSNPATCKAACDKKAQCRAWTLVKPEQPGGMGYCWLKDTVPSEISEECCISGVKH